MNMKIKPMQMANTCSVVSVSIGITPERRSTIHVNVTVKVKSTLCTIAVQISTAQDVVIPKDTVML